MSVTLLDGQYERIKGDLTTGGLTYDPLLDDVLDHVCCMVEEGMCDGEDFETSYARTCTFFSPAEIRVLQHQTLLNLDKRFQRMKNFTYIFGLASAILAIVGSLFKRMHWPGAGLLITIGTVLVVLVFLPLYFYTSHKEQPEEKRKPVYAIVGYLTLAFLLAGALFKIMHWPGANKMILGSVAFILIGFIPLYVVNVFQRSGTDKATLPYVVMLLVGVAIVLIFSNVRISKDTIDLHMDQTRLCEQRAALAEQATERLIREAGGMEDPLLQAALRDIHTKAGALQALIDQTQADMAVSLGQPGASLEEIKGKDNLGAGRDVILDREVDLQLKQDTRQWVDAISKLVTDSLAMEMIRDELDYLSPVGTFTFREMEVAESTYVQNHYQLSRASKSIALAEYIAIQSLLDRGN